MSKPLSNGINLTVLISGEGTNLQALIDALPAHNPALNDSSLLLEEDIRISHVVSNKAGVNGLKRAERAGIRCSTHSLVPSYKSPADKRALPDARARFDADLAHLVLGGDEEEDHERKNGARSPVPNLVLCLGYMLILTPNFLDPMRRAGVGVLNLHPALPGQFDGTKAIHRAWEAGQKGQITESGVMFHEVVEAVDAGKPVVIEKVVIIRDESEADFEKRMHEAEWKVVVQGTRIKVAELRQQKITTLPGSADKAEK